MTGAIRRILDFDPDDTALEAAFAKRAPIRARPAQLRAASALLHLRSRHPGHWATYRSAGQLTEGPEADSWDAYILSLGLAALRLKAVNSQPACELDNPHPGCDCWDCLLRYEIEPAWAGSGAAQMQRKAAHLAKARKAGQAMHARLLGRQT